MTCELDFPHTPLWCQPCWDSEQRGKQVTALNSLTKQIQQLGEVLDMDGVSAPPRPAPVPRPAPPPPPKPTAMTPKQDDYQWKT